jgi:predicted esterase
MLPATARALEAAGVRVETMLCADLGHSIDEDGLRRGGGFLQQSLRVSAASTS